MPGAYRVQLLRADFIIDNWATRYCFADKLEQEIAYISKLNFISFMMINQ
jgi:hypothetical protein